jgi:hypothetical protein
MVNAGRKGESRDVVHAVAKTMQTAFPHVRGVDVFNTTNSILVGTDHGADADIGVAALPVPAFDRGVLKNLDPLQPWSPPEDARVLTDDCAPIEWLTNRIILRELALMVRGR